MKWFKRFFWLLAWGTWAWLGFGLCRELPRDLGPAVGRLPVADFFLFGFVGDTDNLLIAPAAPGGWEAPEGGAKLMLVEAPSGRIVAERSLQEVQLVADDRAFPAVRNVMHDAIPRSNEDFQNAARHGVLLAVRGPAPGALEALDVATGEWRRLAGWPVAYVVVHPSQPWAAVVEGKSPREAERVVVVDLKSDKELWRRDFPPRTQITVRPLFFAGDGALALPILSPPVGRGRWRMVVELWQIADPPVLAAVAEDFEPSWNWSAARKNRVYFDGRYRIDQGRLVYVDVYDFATGQYLTSVPPAELPADRGVYLTTAGPWPPLIAPGGGAVFRYARQTTTTSASGTPTTKPGREALYEVGTGRVLWRPARHEQAAAMRADGFDVLEYWGEPWRDWLPNLGFTTRARRSLDTGELLFRTAEHVFITPRNCNTARTFCVAYDGAVYRLPLQINWPLLAFCQALLALPLVVFWTVLHWRRKRRLWHGGAAP